MPFCLHMISLTPPAPKPGSTTVQIYPPGSRKSVQQKLLVFTTSEHTDKYFSFSDTVRIESSNFFYYGPYLQRPIIATGKDFKTSPTLLSCDQHYQHGEALAGFGNSMVWRLQIWKEKATFFPKPCTCSLWGLSCSQIKTFGKPNATPSSVLSFNSPFLH